MDKGLRKRIIKKLFNYIYDEIFNGGSITFPRGFGVLYVLRRPSKSVAVMGPIHRFGEINTIELYGSKIYRNGYKFFPTLKRSTQLIQILNSTEMVFRDIHPIM